MNHRSLLAYVVGVTVLGSGWLHSQDPKLETKQTRTLPAGWSSLKLTKEQKEKIHVIRDSYKTKIDDLQKHIKDLKEKEKEELLKVLTDRQKKRLKEITPVTEKANDDGKSEDRDKR
jgi:hypothetical protein